MRGFFRKSIVYVFFDGLYKGVFLLLTPLFVQYLTPEGFGHISSVIMFVPLIVILFSLGIDAALTRYIGKYIDGEFEDVFISTLFISLTLFVFFVISALFVVFLCFDLGFIKELLSLKSDSYFLLLIIISASQSSIVLFTSYLKAVNNVKVYSIFYSFLILLLISLSVLFVVEINLSELGYLLALAVANLLAMFCVLLYIFYTHKLHFNFTFLRESIYFSIPNLPTNIIGLVNGFIDRFYLIKLVGVASLGVYFLGIQISSVLLLVATSVNSVISPIFFKMVELDEKSNFSLVYRMYDYIIYGLSLLCSLCFFLTFYFAEYLFPLEFIVIKDILFLLLFIPSIKVIQFCCANALALNIKDINLKSYLIIVNSLINFIVGYLLISKFQLVGAAWSSLVTTISYALLMVYFTRIRTQFTFPFLLYMTVIVAFAFISLMSICLFDFTGDDIVDFFIKALFFIISSFLLFLMIYYRHKRCEIYYE
ncbi:oligosaccharide flippase family protein [Vibrio cholerae]